MAAKKDTAHKTAAPAAHKKAALDTALAQVEKSYGKGSAKRLGAQPEQNVEVIPTGS